MLKKIQDKIVKWINSIRIPRLVDFLVDKSKKEMLDNAPKAEENSERLGLTKISRIGLPVWLIIAVPIAMIMFFYGTEAFVRIFYFVRDLGMIVPLAIIALFILRSIGKD